MPQSYFTERRSIKTPQEAQQFSQQLQKCKAVIRIYRHNKHDTEQRYYLNTETWNEIKKYLE